MVFGIVIKMYFNDHLPPHFHAIYGECVGMFDIISFEMMEGDLPMRAKKLATEWAKINKEELVKMWESKDFKQLAGLE
ncbi:MAG TPA: DUF4160 domain-containing protein [Ruminiclostridium sp.]